jgi:hypothetical protein
MDDLAIAAIINESGEVSTASLATTTTFLNWSYGGTLILIILSNALLALLHLTTELFA